MIELIDPDLNSMAPQEICRRIANLTHNTISLLQRGRGWAPDFIQDRLDAGGLGYQESLSLSLTHWLSCEREGDLILAWANLGALVEGTIQLLLITFDDNSKNDTKAKRDKDDNVRDAEEIKFEELRKFCLKFVWNQEPSENFQRFTLRNWDPYVSFVQKRRNSIHSIRRREIGSFSEWQQMLPVHLSFIRDMFQSRMGSRYTEDDYPEEEEWWDIE